ncbi:MAG TPA: hypothetical protein ENF26_02950 [Methanomicrobia archaeon]|nr:hypothetical protein [Methanomicrobia archaeon]HEX59090.1 hypothetical protein [Methanomicrobia archaeon]
MIRAVEVIALAEGRASPCGNYGDVDDDGIVGQSDYDLIYGYIFWKSMGYSWEEIYRIFKDAGYNPVPSEEEFMRRADVDDDGVVSYADRDLVSQYINGQIDTFPVCEAAPPEEVTRVSQLKALRVIASCQNTGSVDIASPTLHVFVAPMGTFSSESGDPQVDYNNWSQQAEASRSNTLTGTFPPGGTFQISADIPGSEMAAGVKDVALVLTVTFQNTTYYVDSLLERNVIEIVAPQVAAAIANVEYAEVEPQQA